MRRSDSRTTSKTSKGQLLNCGWPFSLNPKSKGITHMETPQQDLPDYENSTVEELEAEVEFLSDEHMKSTKLIGPKVYWLNLKYKARKRRKGTGATAFCKKLGWKINHWRYLERAYAPDEVKAEREAKAQERKARRAANFADLEPERQFTKSIDAMFDELREEFTSRVTDLPLSERAAESMKDYANWVVDRFFEFEKVLRAKTTASSSVEREATIC
jgi:hypothetical protein